MSDEESVGELLKEREGWMYDEFLRHRPRIRQSSVMPSLNHNRKPAQALKREDAPPERVSVQVKFRLKRPRGQGVRGPKSGCSSLRQSSGAPAVKRNNGKWKATENTKGRGPAKRAATKMKDAVTDDPENIQKTGCTAKPSFSDSKFARLFVILRFDHEVRAAFDKSGQVKDKEQ